MCALPVYTAQAPGCSAGELSKAGPGFRALPRSKPLRFRFLGTPQRHRLSWACVLCPSQVQAAQATRCLASAHSPSAVCLITSLVPAAQFPGCAAASQVCHVSLLRSWSLAAILLTDVNYPGFQEDLVSNWEPARSLIGDATSGAEFPFSFQLWLAPLSLPASNRGWASPQPASSPLVFAQSFVLWEGLAVPSVRTFYGKFSLSLSFFFPLSLWLSHSLGCCLTLPPSDCPQGIQAWSFP